MPGPIAHGTIRTSFVLGLRLVVQASTLLLVARMLGPQQFGAFAGIAALAVMLGALPTFGTHLVLLGKVAQHSARSRQVLAYAMPTTIACGALLLVVYLGINATVLAHAGVPVGVLLAIGSAETLLQPFFLFPSALMLARGRVARSQLLMLLPLMIRLAVAGGVLWLQPADPLRLYGYGYFVASALALAAVLVAMRHSIPGWRRWRLPGKSELRHAGGYAALNATKVGPTELDKTLAMRLMPLGDAGLYAAGARVISAVTLPVAAMMFSALPRLFREGREASPQMARLLGWIFAVTLGYSIVLSSAIWFVAPWFEWIFGSKYDGIPRMMRWLVPAIPGMALRIAAGQVLVGLQYPWARVSFEVLGLVALLVIAIIATSLAPETGMPIALAVSEWSMAAFGWLIIIMIRRRGGT